MPATETAPLGPSKPSERDYIVPVRKQDVSIFDGAYTFMMQRFNEEMRRVEDEMNKFGKNLLQLHGETTSYRANLTAARQDPDLATTWESITSSPLIEGEGDDKTLRLQFDVSQFEPEEISVRICDDLLKVLARHQEKTDTSAVYSEYYREFLLPSGTDPEAVESALSKDGILTVTAPWCLALEHTK